MNMSLKWRLPNRRDFGRAVDFLVCGIWEHPIVGIQIMVAILHCSWNNWALVPCAALFSGSARYVSESIFCQLKLMGVESYLADFPDAALELVPFHKWRSLLTPYMRQMLFSGSYYAWVEPDLDPSDRVKNNITVVIIHASKSKKANRPPDPVSFQLQSGSCFVFLRRQPEVLVGFQKFLFLHEIGHATKVAGLAQTIDNARFTVINNALWLVILLGSWSVPTMACVVLAATAYWILRFRFNLGPMQVKNRTILSELAADQFALEGLSTSDLKRCHLICTSLPQFEDDTLEAFRVEAGNSFRNAILRLTIEHILRTGKHPRQYVLPVLTTETKCIGVLMAVAVASLGQSVSAHAVWIGAASVAYFAMSILLNMGVTFNRIRIENRIKSGDAIYRRVLAGARAV